MKIYVVLISFNAHEMVEGAMINFKETVSMNDSVQKVLFDPGYPLPDKTSNNNLIKALCERYGRIYTNMENGDFYVTYDPDVRMNQKGWLPAMVEALNSYPKAMFCSSARDFHDQDWMYKPPYNRKITVLSSGLKVATYDCLIAWASGVW